MMDSNFYNTERTLVSKADEEILQSKNLLEREEEK